VTGEGRRADLLSLVLMLGFATASLTLSVVAVIGPKLESDQGLSASQVGLLMSAFLFSYGAAQIPAGAAASRWGGYVLSAAYGLMLGGSALLAVAGSFPALLVARLLQGLGAGLILPTSGVIMIARVPAARVARAWGIFGAGWGFGPIVALLILPTVVSRGGVSAAAIVTTASMTASRNIAPPRAH